MAKEPEPEKLTFWQRMAMREVKKEAGRARDEPLEPEDWEAVWKLHATGTGGVVARMVRALPSSPRCGICGAPFSGLGSHVVGPLGYRPSRKNPTVCSVCVENSPPGGMNQYIGVLFADLRGFTSRFEGADPREASLLLRRFYRVAEDVLFPDAVIDKLIGDEVMAIYLPILQAEAGPRGRPGPDARARPRTCCAAWAMGPTTARSPRWASASTWGRRSSATSASAPSMTSRR